jgi:rod shape-determining protein MreC
MRPRRFAFRERRPIAPATVLTVLLALGVGLGAWHRQAERQRRPDPVITVTRTVLVPFQRVGSLIEAGVFQFDLLRRYRTLTTENDRLRGRVAELERENQGLRARADEADRLRATVGYVASRKPAPIVVGVIGWLPLPSSQTLTLGAGSRDGLRLSQAVVTPGGLIGRIIALDPFTAQVLLLTDLESGVGALVVRGDKTLATGIVRGLGRDEPLELAYLRPEDPVREGDRVVTSGYGGVFPPGETIGTIAAVRDDTAHFTKQARVIPAAPEPGALREVLVLR